MHKLGAAMADDFHLNMRQPPVLHAQLHGGCTGEVKNPAIDVWPPIGDANVKMLAIRKVYNPNNAAEGHRPMGCSQRVHIEQFPVGGLPSMKLFAIPGGNPTVLDPDVKFGITLWNPGTGTQQHSHNGQGGQ